MRLHPCLTPVPSVTISVTSSYLHFLQNTFLSHFLLIRSTFFLTGPFLAHFVPQGFCICRFEWFLSVNKAPVYTCPFVSQIPYPSCNISRRFRSFRFSPPPCRVCTARGALILTFCHHVRNIKFKVWKSESTCLSSASPPPPPCPDTWRRN